MVDYQKVIYDFLVRFWKQYKYPATIEYQSEKQITTHALPNQYVVIRVGRLSDYTDKLGTRFSDYKLNTSTIPVSLSVSNPNLTDLQNEQLLNELKDEMISQLENYFVEDTLKITLKNIPVSTNNIRFSVGETDYDFYFASDGVIFAEIDGRETIYTHFVDPLYFFFPIGYGIGDLSEFGYGNVKLAKYVSSFPLLPGVGSDYTIINATLKFKVLGAFVDFEQSAGLKVDRILASTYEFTSGTSPPAFQLGGVPVKIDLNEVEAWDDVDVDVKYLLVDHLVEFPASEHFPIVISPNRTEGEGQDYFSFVKSFYDKISGEEAPEDYIFRIELTLKRKNARFLENITCSKDIRTKHSLLMNIKMKEVV